MKTVFITGGTGLIGKALIKRLHSLNIKIVSLLRDYEKKLPDVHYVNGKLEDYLTLERVINEYEVDTIFHLGAQTQVLPALRNPLATFEANIRGTYHLLEAARRHREMVTSIVIASSDKAYGDLKELPYQEDAPLRAEYPYDVSKACADMIARSYATTYSMPIIITRCGNVFGENDDNEARLIPGTILSLLQDKRVVIRSDGTFKRDYIYVEDIVTAYLKCADACKIKDLWGEVFNFGVNDPKSVIEVVETLSMMMGKPFDPLILNGAEKEIKDQYLDTSKAKKMLQFAPQYTFEEGLRKTIASYEKTCVFS